MPVYEYQCTACDHNFELRQGFDSEPICACPQCKNQSRRLFKPAPIIFKGSGFYVTDYNSKSPSASEPVAATETKKEPEAVATAPASSESQNKPSSKI